MSKHKNTVTDFLYYSAMMVVMSALLREPAVGKAIRQQGEAYATAIRIATGVSDEQTAFEQFERDYMAEPDALPQLEHSLNLSLGLEREPEHDAGYYARGLVGAMHGRKKSIHRGGPDHDPIWGETS